jgi:hypothetical protein
MVKNVPIKQARSQDPRKQAILDQRAKENSQQESMTAKLKTAMGMPSGGAAGNAAKADGKFGKQVKSYEERRREQLRREQDMNRRL